MGEADKPSGKLPLQHCNVRMSVEGGGRRALEPQREQRDQAAFRLRPWKGECPEPMPGKQLQPAIGSGSVTRPARGPRTSWASRDLSGHQ